MKITAISLTNVKGFKEASINTSKSINIFIGKNNSGKSTILHSILEIQNSIFTKGDISIGEKRSEIMLFTENLVNYKNIDTNRLQYDLSTRVLYEIDVKGEKNKIDRFDRNEPNNIIYPFLSKRKSSNYVENITEENVNTVSGTLQYLYVKIDRLIAPQFIPGNEIYINACRNILGFEVSTIAKGNGKQAVYYVHNNEQILLTSMGEGVANILGLITDLCVADDHIFLIEELENDIHPQSLKALLNLIVERSDKNQFFISTHSNIVMKYLGGVLGAKVFNVTSEKTDPNRPNLFVSKVEEVPAEPEIRRQVLEDLGYDFFDFDLWKGWLFLEESSAETLIRDYFFDWFAPNLKGRIRTFSAGGVDSVERKFEDFDRLFVFLHLEPTYKNKAWIIIDAGDMEKNIIDKIKERYAKSGWKESSFMQFNEHDFERYYPHVFKDQVDATLEIRDKRTRREEKRILLDSVKEWIRSNPEEAKNQFAITAKDVIEKLKFIESEW